MPYVELNIDQGATFSSNTTLTKDDGNPLSLANTVFVSQIRKSYYSVNAVANIQVTILDSANGVIELGITAANTANIPAGRYLYDVKMSSNSSNTVVSTRILEGIITVDPQVSR